VQRHTRNALQKSVVIRDRAANARVYQECRWHIARTARDAGAKCEPPDQDTGRGYSQSARSPKAPPRGLAPAAARGALGSGRSTGGCGARRKGRSGRKQRRRRRGSRRGGSCRGRARRRRQPAGTLGHPLAPLTTAPAQAPPTAVQEETQASARDTPEFARA